MSSNILGRERQIKNNLNFQSKLISIFRTGSASYHHIRNLALPCFYLYWVAHEMIQYLI
jgi:hypothetical protein